MTSRIRCSCGRVYDPQKYKHCPDCGAESSVESVVVAEKVKPPTPPEVDKEKAAAPKIDILQLAKAVPWPAYGAAAILLLFLLLFGLRSHRSSQPANTTGNERALPTPHEETSPGQTPTQLIPPQQFPSGNALVGGGGNLAQLIANAGDGGTVKLPPGVYQGGAVVSRPVHIVGDIQTLGGQIIIQSEGKECLSVRSKGVTIQNIQFICNGIGDLPAVSISDGAGLEMENCKVQSMSALGLSLSGNASLKTLGCTFSATNGTAIRLDGPATGSFTQSSFADMKIGLSLAAAASAELHACAFERVGVTERDGAIILLIGDKTQLTADDCHFLNNSAGINARATKPCLR